ncbi:MAG: hypothetical protein HQM14_07900 [SAR324 cluster bacterium]|nr:hypothetical protein [SAR324 cluster bacterium]
MSQILLRQRIRQFLVHSFLYYQSGESVISDQEYDRICEELISLLKTQPDDSDPYLGIVKDLGDEASGFSIKNYPPPIISSAMHLLYQENYANQISFPDFVARHGYQLEMPSGASDK